MIDRNIVDYDAEWSIYDEEIMRDNNDFINVEDVDEEYIGNDEIASQIEVQHQNQDDEQSDNAEEIDDEPQSDRYSQYSSNTYSCEDENDNTYSDEKQFSNSDMNQSAEEGGSTCSEGGYCPYCDAKRSSDQMYSSCSEEQDSCSDEQQSYDDEEQQTNLNSNAQQVDQENIFLTEKQPIKYGEGLQIKGLRLEPILPCGHKQQFSDEQIAAYSVEQQQKGEKNGKQFLISLPYRGSNGKLFYRCMCGCSLLFDENANLFFDMSNKTAVNVSDCEFHCPCGCDVMFKASDILLDPIFYGFYQKMVQTKFLSQRPNINNGAKYECKQCLAISNGFNAIIQEQQADSHYDADDEN